MANAKIFHYLQVMDVAARQKKNATDRSLCSNNNETRDQINTFFFSLFHQTIETEENARCNKRFEFEMRREAQITN